MTPRDIISATAKAGFDLKIEGENLLIVGPGPLPLELREAVRVNKAQIISLIREINVFKRGQRVNTPSGPGTVWETYEGLGKCGVVLDDMEPVNGTRWPQFINVSNVRRLGTDAD